MAYNVLDFQHAEVVLYHYRPKGVCKVLDCQVTDSYAYITSEAYNITLLDLHRTKQAEDQDFTEEQLTFIAYSLL